MTLGLIVSFMVTFSLLPTLISFVSDLSVNINENRNSVFTNLLGKISIDNKSLIFIISISIFFISIFGISRLEVENSFINYFSKNTEIYKGMKLIDEKLGGTTPLEVIIKFPKKDDETDEDEWEENESENDDEKYWFTKDKIDKIDKVHN